MQGGVSGVVQACLFGADLTRAGSIGVGVTAALRPTEVVGHQLQLAMQLAPLAHAQEAQEMPLAPPAQLRLGEVLVRGLVCLPQLQDADEFRLCVGEFGMRIVGRGALVAGSFARVLDAEERGDRQHLAHAAMGVRSDQHARQFHVDWHPRHQFADRRERMVAVLARHGSNWCADRAEFAQLLPAVGNRARIGRLQEREVLDPPQTERQHAQDHPGQRRAADLRIGEARPRFEVGLRVQPVAGAVGDAAAAALALVGTGLRDRLDMQAVELAARAVALDPRQSGIDHIADPRHRQRGLGHIGG